MTCMQKFHDQYEKFLERISPRVEAEVRKRLLKILKPHIRGRKVVFQDAMGTTNVMIEHRRGHTYVISDSDFWLRSTNVGELHAFTWADENNCPWVKEVRDLIRDYDDFAQYKFAIEFEISREELSGFSS